MPKKMITNSKKPILAFHVYPKSSSSSGFGRRTANSWAWAFVFLAVSHVGASRGLRATEAESQKTDDSPVHTFSIVGYDPNSGDLGIAVASKFLGVGSIVPWAKANIGAIATQSSANTQYGPDGLSLLKDGKTAAEAVELLTEADSRRDHRQLGIVDASGRAASYTGSQCKGWAGHTEGDAFAIQGNLLAGEEVIVAMAEAYKRARQSQESSLADWLMAALSAGDQAGGDKRGKQSAALMVVRDKAGYGGRNDRFIDLRVEDHEEPVRELARLLEVHKRFFARSHRIGQR